jgi:hypothetical protein
MTHTTLLSSISALLLGSFAVAAQTGPFNPEEWPPTIDSAKTVHYISTDAAFAPPSGTWLADELEILNAGDNTTAPITIEGHDGVKTTGSYLNIADHSYGEWADNEVIDILVQVYGDDAVLNASGEPRDFTFLTGTLPELQFPVGGQIPVEGKNKKWNWVLFRIPNGIRASDGTRLVGSVPANAQGSTVFGGVNGGTIRFEAVPNLIVRLVAFGDEGAFGEPDAINQFFPPESCDPEPNTNLAGIDINANTADHVSVLNDGDQTVTFENNIGPTGDKRRAVRPDGTFLNFAISDQYLGKPCNDPRAVKVCLDFYDDPAFAGLDVRFGPEAYATDDKGGVGIFPPEQRQVLSGSGAWIRRSWTLPPANLKGVNAGSATAGPRFISENSQVFVSRYQIAILRAGEHPLAGQDPLSDCVADPNICTDAYGSFAELNLAQDVRNGIDTGSSGGDQEMIQEEAGPASDRRLAVRPARDDGSAGFQHQYLNFAILDEALGPSSQPPARLAICVTYYDDPALTGATFRPEVYQTERNGSVTFGFTDDSFLVTLEGTDTWRDAYWEINDMKFIGVNQGPQAAARFVVSDKVFFSGVRYGVIRPCGPNAGVNPLASCKPPPDLTLAAALTADKKIRLSWPTSAEGFSVQATSNLGAPQWTPINAAPTVQGDLNVVEITPTGTTFYRLAK